MARNSTDAERGPTLQLFTLASNSDVFLDHFLASIKTDQL